MMRFGDNMSVWEYSKRIWSRKEQYVDKMSDAVVQELYAKKRSGFVENTIGRIADQALQQDVEVIAQAAVKFCELFREACAKQGDSGDVVRKAHEEAEEIRRNAQREAYQCSVNAEVEAQRIRETARAQAEQIRKRAEAEAQRMLDGVNQRIDEDRSLALEAFGREMEAVRNQKIEEARRLASEVYAECQKQFVPTAVADAINGYRREDSAAYAAHAEVHKQAVGAFEDTRTAFSVGMTRLQANLSEQMTALQSELTRSMMDWREQLYCLETMDLAQCAVNLSTILAGIDKRMGDAAVQGDEKTAEALGAVRRNLARFEKQLGNALNSVGLEVYQPQPGDDFDPARHVLSESEKDMDPDKPLAVERCIRPGVMGSCGSLTEAMIRAEVAAKEASGSQPSEPQPGDGLDSVRRPFSKTTAKEASESKPEAAPARPRFDQIIPGGHA